MLHARGLNPWANPVCMLPWQRAGLGKCASPCVQYARAARNLENIRNLARAEEPLSLPELRNHSPCPLCLPTGRRKVRQPLLPVTARPPPGYIAAAQAPAPGCAFACRGCAWM